MTSQFDIRIMRETDIVAVFDVQSQVYVPEMVEPANLITARLAASPQTCWVAEDSHGIGAYLMTYPSVHGKISVLGADFQVADPANALYLHDLAVAPRMSGQGVGQGLVQQALAFALAQQWHYACLVSVQDTSRFWQRLGFLPVANVQPEQRAILQSYSGPAIYCVRQL